MRPGKTFTRTINLLPSLRLLCHAVFELALFLLTIRRLDAFLSDQIYITMALCKRANIIKIVITWENRYFDIVETTWKKRSKRKDIKPILRIQAKPVIT